MRTTKIMRHILGVASALLVTTAMGIHLAEAKSAKQCWADHKKCSARCSRVFETPARIEACNKRCDDAVVSCVPTGGKTNYEQPPEPLDTKGRPRAPVSGGILETKPTFNPRGGPAVTGSPAGAAKPSAVPPRIR